MKHLYTCWLGNIKFYFYICTPGELERFCLPRKVKICPEPWMPESGLVTDSFKVKRKNFEEHFKDDIVEMFKK